MPQPLLAPRLRWLRGRLAGMRQLRAGYRWRTLPFGLSTSPVDEKTLSFGAGFIVGRGGRGAIDIATLRANRTAGSDLSETAWTLSVGITVRP